MAQGPANQRDLNAMIVDYGVEVTEQGKLRHKIVQNGNQVHIVDKELQLKCR
jgi:hypothetical protein